MTTVLVCLLVLYNAWLVTYLLWEKRQGGKRPGADNPPQKKRTADATGIVGKSLFRMEEAAEKVPQAATSGRSEELQEEDVTFADEMPEETTGNADEAEKMPQAQIPDDTQNQLYPFVELLSHVHRFPHPRGNGCFLHEKGKVFLLPVFMLSPPFRFVLHRFR